MTTSEAEQQVWVPHLTFAARLALIRHHKGWNIKEAALACGVPPQSWRGWEIQHRLPTDIRKVARQIAARSGVDRDWLMADDEEANLPTRERDTQDHVLATIGEPRRRHPKGVRRSSRATRPIGSHSRRPMTGKAV